MIHEISKLTEMNCLLVIERPQDTHIIKGRWVFNVKEEIDESLEFRARWVARGDSQVFDLEFDQSLASTDDFIIVRAVMPLSANTSVSLVTIDINFAYLHRRRTHRRISHWSYCSGLL